MAAAEVGGGLPKVEATAGVGGAEEVEQVVCLGGVKKIKRERVCTAKDRISRMAPCVAGKRSSIYRGVTRHRWTGRYEAHLWDKSTWNQNQNKKGKQVYLGAYDDEEAAARAYDLAALKYWGAGTLINFPVTDYARDLEEMQILSKEEYLASLRRKSSAFGRGIPKYRAVSSQTRSYTQMAGSEYFNNLDCSSSRDVAAEGGYASGFDPGRKIDLTGYIRWWHPKKTHQSESTSNVEDAAKELRALESSAQSTEPYQMPSLGLPREAKPHTLSACRILSQSAAFQSFLEKSSEVQRGKGAPPVFGGGELDFTIERTPYNARALVSEPRRTSWTPVNPVPDPVFWASLVPQAGLSLSATLQNQD